MDKAKPKFQIFRQNDRDSAAAEAGENLNLFLTENRKLPVLLLLSAGSALNILEYVGESVLGANLTVSMLDERFSQDPATNNFAQLQKTDFYALAFEAEASFFGSLPRNGESKEDLGKRLEKNLKTWRSENPGGLIVATLGMGRDGHTAGILPYSESPDEFKRLFEGDAWVTAYNAGDKNKFADRVTATLTFFKQLDMGLALVCGPEKQEKFKELLSGREKTADLPALGWHEAKSIKIFTDIH
jgi:6-phosphogluconolactonase/glucosamine-6-phosphate isomerase/deaminase